jgi:hypothetical protein
MRWTENPSGPRQQRAASPPHKRKESWGAGCCADLPPALERAAGPPPRAAPAAPPPSRPRPLKVGERAPRHHPPQRASTSPTSPAASSRSLGARRRLIKQLSTSRASTPSEFKRAPKRR